jgi:hypothetical protein
VKLQQGKKTVEIENETECKLTDFFKEIRELLLEISHDKRKNLCKTFYSENCRVGIKFHAIVEPAETSFEE